MGLSPLRVTVFIENGRVCDRGELRLMSGLRAIAAEHDGDFRLTPNDNLIIAGIRPENRLRIEQLMKEYGLSDGTQVSAVRRNSTACVAFPTCGLAMAESERYLPGLLTKLESLLAAAGLAGDEIVVRMTGCPNGCARPYLAEIGLVGKSLGKYNLYLGGGFAGQRLNRLYQENLGEEEILAVLGPIFHDYARQRHPGERFGDFTIRAGYVREVKAGREFHGL
jgi:sulfite reductase (NADPH) hemoprotein beta-component